MVLDDAIKHCLEAAEQSEREGEVYGLLAKNLDNSYGKLTASRFYTDCAECTTEYRQFAEWLTEYRELKKSIAEYKRLLKVAVEDFSEIKSYLSEPYSHLCDKWRYADEALKLIEEGANET